MGPDHENVTWGTLEPVDSDTDDGGGKGTKDTENAGDEDVMDENAANVEKDPEPEGDDPDEAGSPVAEEVAAFANGYANQPAPGGEDPDDPRAGQNNRPVRGRTTFGERQSNTMNSMIAGQNFSPAVGDPGDPTGPDGPEY